MNRCRCTEEEAGCQTGRRLLSEVRCWYGMLERAYELHCSYEERQRYAAAYEQALAAYFAHLSEREQQQDIPWEEWTVGADEEPFAFERDG